MNEWWFLNTPSTTSKIVTPDVEAACRLYGKAYGWRFQAMGAELGNSFVAELPGGSRCGIRAPLHDQEKPIVRTYLRVTDIERAVERAAQLGGKIALEPVKISGHGKIAIYLYAGIEQGLWQVPSSAAGAEAPAAEPQRR